MASTPNEQYRWDSPYDWLETASRQWDQELLRQQLLRIAAQCDSLDALQDLFEAEMERDGYFTPIPEEEDA